METKFTPGPWIIDPLGLGTLGDVRDSDAMHVAQVQSRVARNSGIDPERDANTRLIAAAPEMYELLYKLSRVEPDTVGLEPMTRMSRLADVCDEIVLAFESIRARINA